MPRVLIAPNTFKGTLTAAQAARVLHRAAARDLAEWETISIPMADGGTGTVAAWLALHGGTIRASRVRGPLGERVTAKWGCSVDGTTAVIEMAECCGLRLVSPAERNPLRATSFGLGQLLGRVLDQGIRRIIIGLGDTATVDGGAGMLQALGGKLIDRTGQVLSPEPRHLPDVARIDLESLHPGLKQARITIACDVRNPLLGRTGAARVFGPQKGATVADIPLLEAGLRQFARRLTEATGCVFHTVPGSGAAGGVGGTLLAVSRAKMVSGAALIVESRHFQRALRACDLVVTGEGRLDRQTLTGKGPCAVAQAAHRLGRPVIVFTGKTDLTAKELARAGFTRIVELPEPANSAEARRLLEKAARTAFQTVVPELFPRRSRMRRSRNVSNCSPT